MLWAKLSDNIYSHCTERGAGMHGTVCGESRRVVGDKANAVRAVEQRWVGNEAINREEHRHEE